METQTFFIRSVTVQDIIMAVIVAIVLGLLIRFVQKGKRNYVVLVVLWGLVAVWFFNSPFWGFSAVTVSRQGLELHYGFLSFQKNTTLPAESPWTIRRYLGGIRKLKKLYYFELPGHQSLKVRGEDKLEILEALGAAIDGLNGKPMGKFEERPVNL